MKVVLKLSLPARRYRFRGRRRMLRALGPDLAAMTACPAPAAELEGEAVGATDRAQPGHKLAHYLPIYKSAVDRTRPIRMLVIGSFYAHSLNRWREFLHADSVIVGVDTNSKLLKIAEKRGIHVRICNEPNRASLEEVSAEFGPFDVILDEGNHTSSHMVNSFRQLFITALTDDGVYMVQDVDCDYLKPYRDSRISFIDFVRALIDAMHAQYPATKKETNHPNRIGEVAVPTIKPVLGSVEVHDSIVLVRRAAG
ncbi:class I SAM-dependent methyltransferase [Mycobacterium sp. E3247]|uniref:class I SAM-dependent methyltransferase n=1 Tax=Mycobacterium sp. E3247 TaxID=1856864 RepID=UPI0012EAB222|nr:class I SAM-dependent methyltransferase [Mycobacterium sp. E3247]